MPGPTDIELSVDLSTDDIKKSANELQGAIKEVFDKSSGKQLDKNLESLKKQMSASVTKAQQLSDQLKKLESTKIPTQEYKEISAQIAQAENKLNKLRDMEERFVETGRKISPQKMKDMQYAAAELENTIEYAKGELQDLIDTGKAFTLGSDTEQYSKVADSLANVNNQSRLLLTRWNEQADAENRVNMQSTKLQAVMQSLSRIMRTLGNSIKSTFKDMVNIFKSAVSSAKKFVSTIASIPSHFKRASSSHNDFSRSLKRGITTILKYGFGIRSLYFLFRKLRTAVADGIKSVVLWEGENGRLNKSISSLQSSLATLKNSVGAMVVPLINSLAPAITKIIDLITLAIQRISQFIAALTGQKTYLVATKVQANYAKSLDKTAGSAKKAEKALKGYLSPLDEINKFESNKDTDSGGGAGAGAGFKEMPIDSGMLDLIEKLKKMWELGDFTELGRKLGEDLRGLLESIPWDKIQATAGKLGKSLATLINGFVEVERLGYDIGNTIAQSLNTIFHFANEFVHNLHWDSIGEFIADTFNGLFENIDWDLIKDTVVTGLQGIAEAINSFIENFHWDNISNFISNAVNTITAGIYEFFSTVNWVDLGKNIGQQLMESIRKINWQDVGRAIGSIIQSAITFVHNFIKQLDAKDIVQALTDMINGFFEEVDTQELGETLAGIIDLAIDVAKGFWEENKDTLKEEGKKLLQGFFDNVDKEDLISALKVILEAVVIVGIARAIPGLLVQGAPLLLKGLLQLISSALSSLGSTLMPIIVPRLVYLMQQIGTVLSGTVGTVLSSIVAGVLAFFGGAEVGKKIGTLLFPEDKDLYEHYKGIKGTFELLKDTVVTLGERTAEHLGNAWDNVKEAGKTLSERTSEHFNNLKSKAETSFENIKTAASTFADRTKEKMDNVQSKLAESGIKFTSFGAGVGVSMEDVNTKVREKIDSIKTKFGEMATTVGEKKTDISNKVNDMKNNVANHFENMKTKAENLKSEWSNKFNTIKSNIDTFKSNASTAFNNIKSTVDTFKSNVSSTFEGIKSNVENLKSNWTSRFNEIKSNVDSFKSNITSAFEGIKSAVINTVQGIANGIKSPINAVLNSIEKMVNGIVDGINAMGDKLGSFDFEIPDWVPGDLGGKKFDLSLPKLNHVTIPKLAQGAVIPPNKEFMAVLGDQKSGTNIETPLSTMIDAFRQVMREFNGNTGNNNGGSTVIKIVSPDNVTLAQAVVEGGKVIQMSSGNNIFELAGG